MLELEILTKNAEVQFRLEVANVGSSRGVANYRATAYPGGAPAVSLRGYPRWCEPAGALCARLLAKALAAKATPVLPPDAEFELRVVLRPFGRLAPRTLEHYRVTVRGNKLVLQGSDEVGATVDKTVPARARKSLEELALYVLQKLYWGRVRIPRPQPVNPTAYQTPEGTPYIRADELPEPVRTLFCKNIAHSGRPWIAHAPDAVFLWDWTAFLAGCR